MLDKADTDYWTTVGNEIRDKKKEEQIQHSHSQQIHFLHSNEDNGKEKG
jgi:hypothetical protein